MIVPSVRIRVTNIDSTVIRNASPGLDGTSLPRVPIIRVFGQLDTGETTCNACVHVHQAYPYLYIEYNGSKEPDTGMCQDMWFLPLSCSSMTFSKEIYQTAKELDQCRPRCVTEEVPSVTSRLALRQTHSLCQGSAFLWFSLCLSILPKDPALRTRPCSDPCYHPSRWFCPEYQVFSI